MAIFSRSEKEKEPLNAYSIITSLFDQQGQQPTSRGAQHYQDPPHPNLLVTFDGMLPSNNPADVALALFIRPATQTLSPSSTTTSPLHHSDTLAYTYRSMPPIPALNRIHLSHSGRTPWYRRPTPPPPRHGSPIIQLHTAMASSSLPLYLAFPARSKHDDDLVQRTVLRS